MLAGSGARGQEAAPASERAVSRSFLEGIWLEHLWMQVDRVRDQPRAVERYARRILGFKPSDRLALKSIIRSVLTRQEYQYATVLCHLGELLDGDDPEWAFHLRRIAASTKEMKLLAPVPSVRLVVMGEQVRQAAGRQDEPALRDLEGQLRDQLARHTQDAGLLALMGEAYEALRESTLACATLREAQALDPSSLPILRAYARVMEAAGEWSRLQPAILASTPPLLRDPEFNAFAGQLLHRNGMAWFSLGYLARWCAAEGAGAEAWEALGLALESIGEENQARAAYIHAVRTAPAPAGMLRKLALLAARDKNAPEAAVWIEQLKKHLTEDELVSLLTQPEFENIPDILFLIE